LRKRERSGHGVTARGTRARFRLRLAFLIGLAICAPASRGLAQTSAPGAHEFSIARLKYGGGGDWYEDRTSMVNLMRGLHEKAGIAIAGDHEAVVEPAAAALFQYPFVFACGHGNMKFTTTELANLRRYLTAGGFLWVDDDFGIEPSMRREMRRLFPEAPMVELPFSHPIFHQLYDFPQGLPKIHEHDGGPPRAYGIVWDGRLVVLFTYDCDLGDGLEDEEIHHDPPEKRDQAMRMGLNIVHFALTH
jgi:hypothetical protein